MLVGVLSDTHGRLPEQAYAALADCDHIIHAGDIGSPDIIRELQTLAPVTAVLGNNDYAEYGSSVGRFAKVCLDGVNFLVTHYPRDVRIAATRSVVARRWPTNSRSCSAERMRSRKYERTSVGVPGASAIAR